MTTIQHHHHGDIQQCIVKDAPPTVCYVANFITEEEETRLLGHIYNAPKPKWTQLSARRLQNWGGLPHPKGMVTEKMPKWLQDEIDRVNALDVFDGKLANHVLVNEYTAGQGIMPHVDGPLFHPTIATLTVGSHTVLDFFKKRSDESPAACSPSGDRHALSLLLERRSLVLLRDEMYCDYLHGIEPIQSDIVHSGIKNLDNCAAEYRCDGNTSLERGTRVSLTIRHVPKVLKVKLDFLKT